MELLAVPSSRAGSTGIRLHGAALMLQSDGDRILFGLTASWLARFLAIGLNVALIPILLRHLDPATVGLWMLIGQTTAILSLLDFGLGYALARELSFHQ